MRKCAKSRSFPNGTFLDSTQEPTKKFSYTGNDVEQNRWRSPPSAGDSRHVDRWRFIYDVCLFLRHNLLYVFALTLALF